MSVSRGRVAALVLVAAAAGSGLFAWRVAAWRPLPLVGAAPADGYVRVAGVVHVHTTLSDGGGTPEEVVAAARAAGLSFVALSDHNNLDAKPLEGEHDGVLVLVGSELSTPAGHVLGLGLDRDPPFRFSDARGAVQDVERLGGGGLRRAPVLDPPGPAFHRVEDTPGPWGSSF
ncbi:MAG: PHP domain-containing protein [Vicinamibacteria bacterium]